MGRYKHDHVLVGDEWKTQKILGKWEKKHFSNTSFHYRFFYHILQPVNLALF